MPFALVHVGALKVSKGALTRWLFRATSSLYLFLGIGGPPNLDFNLKRDRTFL